MIEVARLFQAILAPAIFVSATGLLILSINVRLMGMVTRLRQYVHAKHDAAKNGRVQEAEAYTEQINSIEKRAELIRRSFLLVLISLATTIAACLLLGLGLYWTEAAVAAAIVFVIGLVCLLIGSIYYLREVMVALSSVQQESRDERFMDWGRLRRFEAAMRFEHAVPSGLAHRCIASRHCRAGLSYSRLRRSLLRNTKCMLAAAHSMDCEGTRRFDAPDLA